MTDKAIYARIEQEEGAGPCKSIEGFIVFVTGIHEESQEDQIYDLFSDYGNVKNLHANLDRKTGYLKGYSLVEYSTLEEAEKAVSELNGTSFMGKEIKVSYAFKKPEYEGKKHSRK